MAETVNVDNFVRAETARMLDGTLAQSGAVNRWVHLREPTPLDRQAVIRMNRDTLYSAAIVDIRDGATLTVPDVGDRYLSVMVINEDHFINRVIHDPGEHELSVAEFDTPYLMLGVRMFVDPDDPDDVATVNQLQDHLRVDAGSAVPYAHADFDAESLDATRTALLTLSQGLPDMLRTFGTSQHVDPVRHLIGTASGWGGLPEDEAFYAVVSTPRPSGRYRMTLGDVPVDAFWSITIYNRDGFLEPNDFDACSLNSVTAVPGDDGSVTIDLAPTPGNHPNHLYVMDGWNYTIRLYRPRAEVLDGRWTVPAPEPGG